MKNKNLSNNFGKWGWSTIIYCALAFYISDMIGNCGLNIYTSLFPQIRGWSASSILYIFSIGSWLSVIGVIVFSHICYKIGSRAMASGGYIILGASVLVFAWTKSWGVFCISAVVGVVLAMSILGSIVPQTMMNKWFPEKKGLALGWATMGMPLCSATYPVWVQLGIKSLTFEMTFTIIGAFTIIMGVLSIKWCKNYPEEVGAYPDNQEISEETIKQNVEQEEGHLSRWSVGKLLKSPSVWTMGLGYGFVWMGIVGVVSQLIPRMVSIGFSQGKATLFFSLVSIIGIIGSYLWGLLDQWVGTKKASIIYGIWWIVTYILLIAGSVELTSVACVLAGIGIGGIGNLVPSMQGTLFGRFDFLTANRVIAPILVIVRTCAMTIIGVCLANGFGYTGAYVVMLAAVIIGTILICFIKKPETPIS